MPPEAGSRRWPRWVWTLVLVPAVVLLVLLALRKSLGIDEFLYLHWGAEAAQGRFAGSDYFAIHFALLQLLLAPLFLVLDPSSTAPVFAARGLALGLYLVAVTAAFSLLSALPALPALPSLPSITGQRRRLLGATLLLSTHVLVTAAVEVRPDLLSLSLLCCGAALYLRTTGRLPALVAGLLLGGAILSSEKALLHGLAFAATLALGLWRARQPGSATRMTRTLPELRRALLAAGAVVAVLGVAAGGLYQADGLRQFRLWLEFSRLHETAYPTESFASLKEIARVLAGAPFLLLAPIGAWHLARRALRVERRDGNEGSEGSEGGSQALCDGFIVAAALVGLLSVLLQKAPYRYSLVLFILFGTLLAVEALGVLSGIVRSRLTAAALRRFGALAPGLLVAFLVVEFRRTVTEISRPELAQQLATLETLFRLTTPADCVYDNSTFAYSRRHVDDFFLTTDATMRMAMKKELAQRIPTAIRERQCTVFKDDPRSRDLPRSLRKFLDSHYVRIAPDLFLWGQRYAAGSSSVGFEAVAPGLYYLWPESAEFASGGRTVTLPRGESTLAVAAPGSFYILWLPRDGRTYPPVEEVAGQGSLPGRVR